MRKLIVILGPTASGKSALGVRLARKFKGIVISADSRQVYRGLDIGTAKITKREMRGVPHYLLSVASPQGQYSVSRYVRDVQRLLKRIPASTPVFVVGGSPFYIKALTEPISFSAVKPDLDLRRRLDAKSTNQLINLLTKLDPTRAKIIDRANRRRLIRAIEIALSQSPPYTRRGAGVVKKTEDMRTIKLGLRVPRTKLYRKIDQRVDARIRQGMIREVRRLHAQGVSWKRLDAFGLEYRWIAKFLRGQLERAEMIARLKGDIHAFVRRQETWWRKEPDIIWLRTPADATQYVKKFLDA